MSLSAKPGLPAISDRALSRLPRILALVLLLGSLAFAAFYLLDRALPTPPPAADQAITALEAQVRADPSDISLRGRLADLYTSKGRFTEAVAVYSEILASGRADEAARFGRAAAYLGLDNLPAAADDYRAVVAIAEGGEMAGSDTILEGAYYGLGLISMRQEKAAEAIGWLEKALSITRSDADALYLIGTAFLATGQNEKAVTVLRAAVTFVPSHWADPYLAMAKAYRASARPELADWAQAMADLAAGSPATAETALKALAGGPAALDAAVGLGLLYETRGDTAAAFTWYSAALALAPDNSAAQMGIARVRPPATEAP
jgi:tetratricopeptide (TPR) repeat protein